MIIIYNKRTGDIIGTVEGRVHDPDTLEKSWIQPSNIEKKDIGKYIVLFKTKYKIVEQPKTETRVVDKKTMKVEKVKVGTEMVKQSMGMEPDVPFASLILDFESGKKRIYDYKVKLKKDEVVGFMLK